MTYIIAEIGINHNGDLDNVIALIDVACEAGCDAVKFQKRTPELCVPIGQRNVMRDTPWGRMTYMDYRNRVELGRDEYDLIDKFCSKRGIDWFASVWDVEAVSFMDQYDVPFIKIPSALLTNDELILAAKATGIGMMISTGMSTMEEIDHAVSLAENCIIMHTTSTYPCPPEQLNLSMIPTLRGIYGDRIGYSGHEVGLQTTVAAVALGAKYVERHITLDRTMWGSDQAASVEPGGLERLVRDIRVVGDALGDGVKHIYESEAVARKRLRGN